jgi:hypothetical protein
VDDRDALALDRVLPARGRVEDDVYEAVVEEVDLVHITGEREGVWCVGGWWVEMGGEGQGGSGRAREWAKIKLKME